MAQVINKIVVTSEFFDPNENSTGFLVHELYVSLQNDCTVQRAMPAKFLSNWKPQKRGPKLLKKVLILIDIIFKTRRLSDRDSVLLIVSNPFLNWFLTRLVGDFKAIHFLAFDVFPETGSAFLSNRIINALKKLRRWSLAHKLTFICIGRDMGEYLSREYPNKQMRNVGIWVGPIKLGNREKHTDSPKLLFFGNFGELTDFFVIKKLCQAGKRDYGIKVVGNGSEKFFDHIDSTPPVTLSKAVRFEERSSVYINITASLVVQHPRLKGLAVPSKAFFSWENHVPIIYFGARDSELFRLIDEHPFLGYAFEYHQLDSSETCGKVNSIMIKLSKVHSDPRIGEWLAKNRIKSLAGIKSLLSDDKS